MIRVLFVEASQGGVVGGSLTGLYHLVRGLPRERYQASMVLYEPKVIEVDLSRLGVAVYHVKRRRLPKETALHGYDGYRRARQVALARNALSGIRQLGRVLVEELPVALALARVIRRSGADVAHLGNGLRANFDALLACRLTKTPVVCHVKGFEKYGGREQWASRRVASLVCMTDAILDHCRSHGISVDHARVVYDAVDEAWLRPRRSVADVRSELGLPGDAPCIGIVGNVQEWKGQAVLVEALASIAQRVPPVQALIVGGVHRAGASYAAALRRRVEELGLGQRVHFVGFREDVVDVVNALDVLVHASVRPEPFGRVILEGMLLGKPVIATKAGGVLELVEHGRTGFLVRPGDVQALASCLGEVLANPQQAAAVGARARAWAAEKFSLAKHVREMSTIYEAATLGNGDL